MKRYFCFVLAMVNTQAQLAKVSWRGDSCSDHGEFSGTLAHPIDEGQEEQAASLTCPDGQNGNLFCEYSMVNGTGQLRAIWRGAQTLMGLPITASSSICSRTGGRGRCCWPDSSHVAALSQKISTCETCPKGWKWTTKEGGWCQPTNGSWCGSACEPAECCSMCPYCRKCPNASTTIKASQKPNLGHRTKTVAAPNRTLAAGFQHPNDDCATCGGAGPPAACPTSYQCNACCSHQQCPSGKCGCTCR